MRISYSRASSYLRCPQQHYFNYIECLSSNKVVRPLSFGSDFHKLLEYRNDKEGFKKAFAVIRETYRDLPMSTQSDLGDNYLEDLKTVFNDYRKTWKGSAVPQETEHEFLIKVGIMNGEPIEFYGFIDEVFEGGILGEHKTFSSAPNMSTLAMNMQACLYAKAWELETGERLDKVRWDYIKSIPSKYPIWLNKSGRFSEAANQGITPYSWARACKEKGVVDPLILQKGTSYQQNVSNFFFRCDIEFVPSMVESVWTDFKYICREIATKGTKNKVKNITRDCSWCNYQSICYGEFTGADVEYIKKTDFIIKER